MPEIPRFITKECINAVGDQARRRRMPEKRKVEKLGKDLLAKLTLRFVSSSYIDSGYVTLHRTPRHQLGERIV